jgi:hypothetical protein
MSEGTKNMAERRGFLKALGLGGAAAAAVGVAEAAGPIRADAVPAGTARKENEADRLKARYQANSAHVQAFYRTNRYGG